MKIERKIFVAVTPSKDGETYPGRRKLPFLHPIILILFAMCLLTSCATPGTDVSQRDEYSRIFDKWKRSDKVYRNLETNFLIEAVYKSEELRRAYVKEYSRAFMLDESGSSRLMDAEISELNRHNEFIISLHTPDREQSSLEGRNVEWALYLLNDRGERVSTSGVREIKNRETGNTVFYPFKVDWTRLYSVKFPLTTGDQLPFISSKTGSISLVITGPAGTSELTWELAHQ